MLQPGMMKYVPSSQKPEAKVKEAPVKTEQKVPKLKGGVARASIPKWKDRTSSTHGEIMKFVETAEGRASNVVMLGSSMFERWKTSGEKTWKALNFDRFKICNAGIGGDKSENVLWRLHDGKMFENFKPKLIVLMIGTNNLGSDHPDDISNGIFTIIDKLRKDCPLSHILLIGVLTRNDELSFLSQIRSLNSSLAAKSKTFPPHELTFVEFPRILINDDDTPRGELFDDHVHLNENGYGVFGEVLEPLFVKLVG
eukprot:TRINITY_DN3778_c0_g1_i1.p1 TRINITY_DN3778_c0_g1~~TRINITY_DN3778_c0_g1_i1.p1  ORF type:complete len:254 (+),score=44.09 TRINITY_DN3778_c0_g1_i1:55-816(+)